jgi:hypothetical protein
MIILSTKTVSLIANAIRIDVLREIRRWDRVCFRLRLRLYWNAYDAGGPASEDHDA